MTALDVFKSTITTMSENTAYKYRKTLVDFDCFISCHKLTLTDYPDIIAADWATELLRQSLSTATVAQRLNILNSLYKTAAENGLIKPCHTPREIARQIEASDFTIPPLLKASVFDKSLSLIRRFAKDSENYCVYGDILIFSLLNKARNLEEIIYLKKEDIKDHTGHSRNILERKTDSRRRYVFDLKQSIQTKRQIVSTVTEAIKQIFSHIPWFEKCTFEDLANSLWVALAIRSGATLSEAYRCLNRQAPYVGPSFCKLSGNGHESPLMWQNAIDILITHELPKWYAMHLRRGVCFSDIRQEILDRIKPVPELFYPVESIRKKLKGKTKVIEQPFISQTVFFKSYPENVLPMFSEIGDKAWCIKVSSNSDAPYAVIPRNEMLRFQQAIGVFSSDTEVHPLGSLVPKPGETVILIQAGYDGREAKVEEVLQNDCGTVLFRIKLATDYGYEWRTTVDARMVELIARKD